MTLQRTLNHAAGLALTIGLTSSGLLADEKPPSTPISENPYIELYKLRVTQAELNVSRRHSLEELASSRLERGRRLIASRAISQEEYEVLTSEATVASADRVLAVKKVDEAKTYLRIVEALVKRGISIPLCTYEME